MKKAYFVVALLLIAAFASGYCFAQRAQQVFYISFPVNYYSMHPIKVHATDRLDAITKMGITVWSEKEWLESTAEIDKGGGPHFTAVPGIYEKDPQ